MIILYINGEHCTSVEQFKGYFSEDLTPESDTYADLLDYGRHGDIADWLLEQGEQELSSKVTSISTDLCDSAFYAELKGIITGVVSDTHLLKPSFDQCFSCENIKCEGNDTEVRVCVSLKVLMCVNEEYMLSVSSHWGMRGMKINPYSQQEGKTVCYVFTLNKRPCKDIGEITVMAESKVLSPAQPVNNNTSTEEFTVKGVSFKMIHVEGGNFQMGNRHKVAVDSFWIGETVVTCELWAALHNCSLNPDSSLLPVCCTWSECQSFIEKLNQETGKQFRLPSETEWEFAARGGNKSKGFHYAGSDSLERVGWYKDNADKRIHSISQKQPNELGLYDMSGNVSEWCNDSEDGGYRRIARGGSYRDYGWRCQVTDSCSFIAESRKIPIGFRLALVNAS